MSLFCELLVYRLPDNVNLCIDHRPSRKATYDPVVDDDIGMDLPRALEAVLVGDTGVVVAVDRKELQPLALAPVNGILQHLTGPRSPEDDVVTLRCELLESPDRKRFFNTYCRILVLNDGPVEVNCDAHLLVVAVEYQSSFLICVLVHFHCEIHLPYRHTQE